jgi:hypothetical protein
MKNNVCLFMAVLVVAAFPVLSLAASYSGGSGSPAAPYRISVVADWKQLMATPADWNANFILTSNIDLTGITVTPVGVDVNAQFTGVLDGNGHTINNAAIHQPDSDLMGLFGWVGTDGQIKNLGVINADIQGREGVGVLAGYMDSGSITSCYATGSVGSSAGYVGYVGGLVGENWSATIASCYAMVTVKGTSVVGGLAGYNRGMITDCYATGTVKGGANVGGLMGTNYGTIATCYATGSVGANTDNAGGLVGYNESGPITSCNATGAVSGSGNNVGGLVGQNKSGPITSSFAAGTVSGKTGVGGLVGFNDHGPITFCDAMGNGSGTGQNVGGLVGDNFYGTISSCSSTGILTGTDSYDGGLVGWNRFGSITSCYATGSVSGTGQYSNYVGGLVGDNYRGSITVCYATGAASGNTRVGGLVGQNEYGPITSCYARGNGNGTNGYAGGLVGYNSGGTITSCYAAGLVSGSSSVGGLAGVNSGSIRYSFWDVQTSGQTTSSDGIGIMTDEMKKLATFTDAGWDFLGESSNGTADTWRMCANGVSYPRLSWEFSRGGDFDCPNGVDMIDFAAFASRWDMQDCAGQIQCGAADLNNDGRVDLADFAIFAAQWLQGA